MGGDSDFTVKGPGAAHLSNGVVGLAHTSSQKLLVCVSSQLDVQWCHFGYFKTDHGGNIYPENF